MNTSDLPTPVNKNILLFNEVGQTATVLTATQTNISYIGAQFFFDITVIPGGNTLTPAIFIVDPVSLNSSVYVLFTSLNSVSFTTYTIYPTITDDAGFNRRLLLPYQWQFGITNAGGGACDYTVSGNLIL